MRFSARAAIHSFCPAYVTFSRKYDIFILTGGDVETGLQGYMDYAYLLEQVKDYQHSLEEVLPEDLRMVKEDILAMNSVDIEFLVSLYRKKLLMDLLTYLCQKRAPLRRKKSHA